METKGPKGRILTGTHFMLGNNAIVEGAPDAIFLQDIPSRQPMKFPRMTARNINHRRLNESLNQESLTHFRQFHRHFKKPLSHNQQLTLEKAEFRCNRSA